MPKTYMPFTWSVLILLINLDLAANWPDCLGMGVRYPVREPDLPDLRGRRGNPSAHDKGLLLPPPLLPYRYSTAGLPKFYAFI